MADFARLGDVMTAAVEVHNPMAGDSADSLKPLDFAEDQHNLLAFGNNLPVATVLGIYVSQDLRSFKGVGGVRPRPGAPRRETRPPNEDQVGDKQRRDRLCVSRRLAYYSTTETYGIGEGRIERLFKPHSMTRKAASE
jgi:hypothetical protein